MLNENNACGVVYSGRDTDCDLLSGLCESGGMLDLTAEDARDMATRRNLWAIRDRLNRLIDSL